MHKLKVLKLKIYQPHAHYRIPFAYQRRHTYPIPPYSTIIGLLCNLLGIRNYKNNGEPCENSGCSCDYHKLKHIKISICGNFKSKTTEYTWFRNLARKSHDKRFGYSENRCVSGYVEHIGGQMPVLIDVLNDVKVWIYLFHEDSCFLEKIEEVIKEPNEKIYPLHLGRAEDLIVLEEISLVDLKIDNAEGNYRNFFWIPENIFYKSDSIKFAFEKIGGLLYTLPSFYKLQDGVRNFDFIEVKLNDGIIKDQISYLDPNDDIPVFLGNFGG